MPVTPTNPSDNPSNPAGPRNLLANYLTATDQFVRGQLLAQAVSTQQLLTVVNVDAGLAVKVAEYQRRTQTQATYFYQQLIQGNYGFIFLLSNGYNLCALANAGFSLEMPTLTQPNASPLALNAAGDVFNRLSQETQNVQVIAETLATKAYVANQSYTQYIQDYQATLTELEKILSGSEQALVGTIDALKVTINKNIADIVAGAEQIGGAVSNLIVGVITQLPTDKAGVKPDASKPPAPTAPAAKPDNAFAVQAISAATQGASQLSQAEQDLNANNAKLARAYQQLAEVNQLTAIAKAIAVQTELFGGMLPLAANSAHGLSIELLQVQTGLAQYANDVRQGAPEIGAQAQAAVPAWTALASELQSMKLMMINQ
ncbi:hypothetical protein HNQ59_002601 [Chitinivorax tropicus]|uniref:HBL/NHE enterotoxin family protein n=1 Tax=Chitinivorax tropicus TaxID=714531 RepID=A0A840MSQ0_9PROT|nr:hypothetical protein [Chitinivorax tropicus]MBB5019303.1 hypothetical protein [Chitinivorax tropicus]